MELASRRVEILGIDPEPDGRWMLQIARNATDGFSGYLLRKGYLIIDRDPRYTREFRSCLSESGVQIVRTPPRRPHLNAYAERFVRSVKEECLCRMIFFSEGQLRSVLQQYVEHYHTERNHQGLGNRVVEMSESGDNRAAEKVVSEPRLGGLLNHYRRAA